MPGLGWFLPSSSLPVSDCFCGKQTIGGSWPRFPLHIPDQSLDLLPRPAAPRRLLLQVMKWCCRPKAAFGLTEAYVCLAAVRMRPESEFVLKCKWFMRLNAFNVCNFKTHALEHRSLTLDRHASHTVRKFDAAKRMVTIAYRQVKSLGWPSTTIDGYGHENGLQ